jgi:hypothetical protein
VTGANHIAKGKAESIKEYWSNGWIDGMSESKDWNIEHMEAVKKAFENPDYVPPEGVMKTYCYEEWVPERWRDMQQTKSQIERHGMYMNQEHAYYLGHLQRALTIAAPKIGELMKKAASDFKEMKGVNDARLNEAAEAEKAYQMLNTAIGDFEHQYRDYNDRVNGWPQLKIPPDKMPIRVALGEDREKAKQKFFALSEEAVKLNHELGQIWLSKLLPAKGDDMITIPVLPTVDSKYDEEFSKANNFLRKSVAQSWGHMPVKVAALPPTEYRGSHSGDTINLPPTPSARLLIHEFGHHIESQDSDTLGLLSRAFAMEEVKRTGESPKSLGAGYKPTEIGARDDFMDSYVGKFYEFSASEVLAMGMQEMYLDPLTFYQKAPRHFEYTLACMHGLLTPDRAPGFQPPEGKP